MFAQAGRVLAGALIAGAKGRRQEEPRGGSGLPPRLGGHGRAPGALQPPGHGGGCRKARGHGRGAAARPLAALGSRCWGRRPGLCLSGAVRSEAGWAQGISTGSGSPGCEQAKARGGRALGGGVLLGPTPGACGARARGQSELVAGGGSSLSHRPFLLLPQAYAGVPKGWPPARQVPAQPRACWAPQLPASLSPLCVCSADNSRLSVVPCTCPC